MRVSSAAIKKFVNFWHDAVYTLYSITAGRCRLALPLWRH